MVAEKADRHRKRDARERGGAGGADSWIVSALWGRAGRWRALTGAPAAACPPQRKNCACKGIWGVRRGEGGGKRSLTGGHCSRRGAIIKYMRLGHPAAVGCYQSKAGSRSLLLVGRGRGEGGALEPGRHPVLAAAWPNSRLQPCCGLSYSCSCGCTDQAATAAWVLNTGSLGAALLLSQAVWLLKR